MDRSMAGSRLLHDRLLIPCFKHSLVVGIDTRKFAQDMTSRGQVDTQVFGGLGTAFQCLGP